MKWGRSKSVESIKIPARARLPIDEELCRRMSEARALLPENNVKRLIEDQPDTFVKPVDFDELPT